jgi:hypothetical protein
MARRLEIGEREAAGTTNHLQVGQTNLIRPQAR